MFEIQFGSLAKVFTIPPHPSPLPHLGGEVYPPPAAPKATRGGVRGRIKSLVVLLKSEWYKDKILLKELDLKSKEEGLGWIQ
jgi:hypothetical protein